MKGPDGTNAETAASEIATKTRDTMKAFFRILHSDPSFFTEFDKPETAEQCRAAIHEAHQV